MYHNDHSSSRSTDAILMAVVVPILCVTSAEDVVAVGILSIKDEMSSEAVSKIVSVTEDAVVAAVVIHDVADSVVVKIVEIVVDITLCVLLVKILAPLSNSSCI